MRHALTLCAALLATLAAAAIDDAAAAKAAMDHAGVKTVGPRALYVAPDREDGRLIYDVRFHDGASAYNYEVAVEDGRILKAEREALPTLPAQTAQAGDIGAERAKAVALADAKTKETPRRVKVERDSEDGVWVYEVEFRADGMEYDYVIDAAKGTILKREAEPKRGFF